MGRTSRSVSTLANTHGLVMRAGTQIWATSEGRGWQSLFASAQHEAPFGHYCRAIPDPLIVLHLNGPIRVSRMLEGRHESCLIPSGGLFIMLGGVEFGVRRGDQLDTIHFYLRRSVVDEVASDIETNDTVEILLGRGERDPFLEQIALCLREQRRDSETAATLYVDHLARATAARSIDDHSSIARRAAASERKHGLSVAQLRRAVVCIEGKFDRDPALSDAAAAVGLGSVYFARQFRMATGLPPYRNLMQARIERAKWLPSATKKPIAAIALECAFCHQDHLTRVFRKHSGATPGAYRATLRS